MAKITQDTVFKPSLSKSESKAEAVSHAAMNIIEQEIAARDAKTARLRAARLAEEATRQVDKAPAKAAAKRRRTAAS